MSTEILEPTLTVIALMAICLLTHSGAVSVAAFGALAVLGLLPIRMVVGADGVRVAWLGSRFVPYGDVVALREDGRDPFLELAGGTMVHLPIASKNRRIGDAAKRLALMHAINLARTEYAQRHSQNDDVLPPLDAIGQDDGGAYRVAAVEPDRLWRVVEDPSAAPQYRVAAVSALAPTLDDAGRKRIEEVAEASASLRRAADDGGRSASRRR